MKCFFERVILVAFLVLSYLTNAQSSSANIEGCVKDVEDNIVKNAHVNLKGTNFKTITDNKGFYKFTKLPTGNYTLLVSFVGKKTERRKVDVIKGSVVVLNIVLENKIENLDEVLVNGKKVSPVAKKESSHVARLPIKNIENPQVYATVSKELMKTQIVTDFDGALKNIVGAGIPIRYNQNRVVLLSRGFQVEPKFRNGLTTYNQNYTDPVNLERIEIYKGPTATLFGSTEVSYGGLLNRVTKRPYEDFGGSVAYSGGSWNLNRVTFDANTPLNKAKTLLLRTNGAVHKERSFQDAGFYNNIAFTPSLSYKIDDKTAIFLDVEYTSTKGTSPVRHSPYTDTGDVISAEDFIDDYNTSYTSNDIYYNGDNLDVFGELRHQLSENWVSSTSFARTESITDGYTSRIDGRSATTFRTRVFSGYYGYNSTNLQQNFTGKFNIGKIKNRIVAGLNFYKHHLHRDITFFNTSDFEYATSSDLYSEFNKSFIDTAIIDGSRTFRNQKANIYSAYVSDVINFSDRFLAMLSLRFDHFESKGTENLLDGETTGAYSQNALSPKLGVVYQIVPEKLSVFGNYMNGFTNQNGVAVDGTSFTPEQANQIEGGFKYNFINNKLSGSVSYYDIEVKNIVREDPDNSDFEIQDGSRTSKGIEIELIANPVENFNVLIGFSNNISELQNTDGGEEDGVRPATAGPETLINFWLDYSIPVKNNKVILGLGGNYGSESFQANTIDASVTIPSYSVFDVGVTYQLDKFSIGLKGNNLTNEKYWSYRLAPQKLRNVVANLSFNF